MFLHIHPYKPFLFSEATKLIVGTLPPPRFSTGKLKKGDVDFCYGSKDGQLWPILDKIFNLNLKYENTIPAINHRKLFLKSRKIAICDIVDSAHRLKIDASDLGMQDIKLRDVIDYIDKFPNIKTILFTGGNSKNGPEFLFRKLLKKKAIEFEVVSNIVPRVYKFVHPTTKNTIQTVSLIAPSGAANIAVGSLDAYKKIKAKNSNFNTVDFRIMQYQKFF